jgi:hypothetical protein
MFWGLNPVHVLGLDGEQNDVASPSHARVVSGHLDSQTLPGGLTGGLVHYGARDVSAPYVPVLQEPGHQGFAQLSDTDDRQLLSLER